MSDIQNPEDQKTVLFSNHVSISALFYQKPLGPEDEIIESVITSMCYEGRAYEPPHVPDIFEKNLAALEKKKSEKGELYKKMRSMYENSLPIRYYYST